MAAAAGLAALAVATSASPVPSELTQALLAEVVACLRGEEWTLDRRHVAVGATDAPGLPRNVAIARIVGAPGRLFVYKDRGGRVIECGVALYDRPPPEVSKVVDDAVRTSSPKLVPADPSVWRLEGGPGLKVRYWGAALSPSIFGVLVRESDGLAAPTFQFDRHSVLIQ